MNKKTVLSICSLNSVRSRIAEGLLNARCHHRYRAFSAGIAPAGLSPYAVAVMREAGTDISSHKPKRLTNFTRTRFDYVISQCDPVELASAGSVTEGVTLIHRGFVSPSEVQKNKAELLADFRKLRDDINAWLCEIFPDCPKKTVRVT